LVNALEVHERRSGAPTSLAQLLMVVWTVDAALHLFFVQGTRTPLKQVAKVCATHPEPDRSATITKLTRTRLFVNMVGFDKSSGCGLLAGKGGGTSSKGGTQRQRQARLPRRRGTGRGDEYCEAVDRETW
jgi:hypothetical protein